MTADRSRPRLLFYLPSLALGGAERHAIDLVERLREAGFPCDVLVHSAASSPAVTAMAGAEGAVILGLKGMSDPAGWPRIWREMRRLKPDIVVAINQTPFIISVVQRLARGIHAKVACIFHTTQMQPFEVSQEPLFRWASRLGDLMIYVGRNQQQLWRAKGARPRNEIVIPNGIDLVHFDRARRYRHEIRAQLGIADDVPLFGILAALRSEKNHVEFVRALALAKARGIQAQMLAIGDGPKRAEIVEAVQSLGLGEQAHLVGEQADVKPWIGACDVGILCSTSETFPLSALEFLAAGVPMISAEVGGAPEIVHDNVNGRLYPPGNVEAFADAIVVLADPAQRQVLADAAPRSVARFSVEAMVGAYVEAFMALAQGRPFR